MKKVLIIEDNPPDAEIATLLVNRLEGEFDFSYCIDGIEVMHALKNTNHIPDYILLDLNIPKFNGLEVLRIIKQTPHLASTRVLILSGNDDKSYIKGCLELNADGYIVKRHEMSIMQTELSNHMSAWSH